MLLRPCTSKHQVIAFRMNAIQISLTLLVLLASTWFAFKKYFNKKIVVSKLFVYPVKSFQGVQVKSLQFDEYGVKYDRRFVVIDSHTNKFVTIRQKSRMTLIKPILSEEGVHLVSTDPRVSDLGTVFLPFEDNKDVKPEPVDIFGIKGTGVAISEEVDRWITKFIEAVPSDVGPAGSEASEGKSDSNDSSQGKRKYRYRILRLCDPRIPDGKDASEALAFQDGAHVMCANESSWAAMSNEVQKTGSEPVYMEQMRPNIVVTGPKAWDEDNWGIVQGPRVMFRKKEPCQRCILTTVNTFTGEIDRRLNPLSWLRKNRRPAQWYPKTPATAALGETPMFGIFFYAENRFDRLHTTFQKIFNGKADPSEVLRRSVITLGDELLVSKRSYEAVN